MKVVEAFPKHTNSKSSNGQTFKLVVMLFSRMMLFAIFQATIALTLNSWHQSEKYWMLVATMGNFVGIFLLVRLFKSEGKNYFNLFHIEKQKWKNDLLLFNGLTLLGIPIAIVPNYFLSKWFWGDPVASYEMLFQPLPILMIYFLLIAFPITIALAELPTYFGYIMPRLEKQFQKKWLAVLLPVIFLSFQHCCLPLVFNSRFIIYRGLMYLPFALLIGISLRKRPELLPYFAILHGLMDMQTVVMLLIETYI